MGTRSSLALSVVILAMIPAGIATAAGSTPPGLEVGVTRGLVEVISIPSGPMARAALAFSREGDLLAVPVWGEPADDQAKEAARQRPRWQHWPSGVLLWDMRKHAVHSVLLGHAGYVRDVDFSPDGALLASAGNDGTVRVWDVREGKERYILKPAPPPARGDDWPRWSFPPFFFGPAFSPDGDVLVVHTPLWSDNDTDAVWHSWDVATGRQIASGEPGYRMFLSDGRTLKLDPDPILPGPEEAIPVERASPLDRSRRLPFALRRSPFRVWDAATGEDVMPDSEAPERRWPWHAARLSPDGASLATWWFDQSVRRDRPMLNMWDVSTGQYRFGLGLARDGNVLKVMAGEFSPDGQMLAYGYGRAVHFLDVRTGRDLFSTPRVLKPERLLIAFSPDGRLLAAGSPDNDVTIWDVAALRDKAAPQEGADPGGD